MGTHTCSHTCTRTDMHMRVGGGFEGNDTRIARVLYRTHLRQLGDRSTCCQASNGKEPISSRCLHRKALRVQSGRHSEKRAGSGPLLYLLRLRAFNFTQNLAGSSFLSSCRKPQRNDSTGNSLHCSGVEPELQWLRGVPVVSLLKGR